jgi:hypothetical protein
MGENNETKCCICIPIEIATKLLCLFSAISVVMCILNILGTLNLLGSIGGIILLIIIALGQIAAAFCFYKFVMVFWPHIKKEDHNDADRDELVNAFKWLFYASAAMYISTAIGYMIFYAIWAPKGFGIGAGINMLISMIISLIINWAIMYWWRNTYQNHVAINQGKGPVGMSLAAAKADA